MTSPLPRGGKSGKSVAPRKTLHKDKKPPQMWLDFLADCRKFREAHGMSTRDVAVAMGVSVSLISTWERGHSTPHPHDLTVYLKTIGANRIIPTE